MCVSPALSPSLPAFLKAPDSFKVITSANINTLPFPSSGRYRLRPNPIDRPEGADFGAERESTLELLRIKNGSGNIVEENASNGAPIREREIRPGWNRLSLPAMNKPSLRELLTNTSDLSPPKDRKRPRKFEDPAVQLSGFRNQYEHYLLSHLLGPNLIGGQSVASEKRRGLDSTTQRKRERKPKKYDEQSDQTWKNLIRTAGLRNRDKKKLKDQLGQATNMNHIYARQKSSSSRRRKDSETSTPTFSDQKPKKPKDELATVIVDERATPLCTYFPYEESQYNVI
ncbi:hypothetical protein MMC22_008741 [Lobaria immixta]|nr:hypothetical protein [Lobaria immixta]